MVWERRGKNQYFYTSRRDHGRVIKVYFGRGEVAQLAESVENEARSRRTRVAEQRRTRARLLRRGSLALEELRRECNNRIEVQMGIAGFHRLNRGQWRRRRGGASFPRPPYTETEESARILIGADSDLVRAARQPWIELMVGQDAIQIEEFGRQADRVRDELLGEDFRSDTHLLAEYGAVAWMAWECAKQVSADREIVKRTSLKDQNAAKRRFQLAANNVATLREVRPIVFDHPAKIQTGLSNVESAEAHDIMPRQYRSHA